MMSPTDSAEAKMPAPEAPPIGGTDLSVKDALREMAKIDPYLWAATHRRLKGKALLYDISHQLESIIDPIKRRAALFRHRPFLIQPLTDMHPHKVYKKARQVGVSELALNEVLWFLDSHPGSKWVTTFPRDSQLQDFSTTRISEALNETAAMRRLIGLPNQVRTKRIGDSYLLLRSAWDSTLGEGVDADGVTLDEKDRMREGVEYAFRESLKSSKYAMLREISTPTLPGRGIDAPYQRSCQYRWYVKCSKCGKKQTVRFPENVIQQVDVPHGATQLPPNSYAYQCDREDCRGELDRLHGEWIPDYPGQTHIAGYHMPQTIAPWITATEIMQSKIDIKHLQLFQNYVLADCSRGERLLLTEEDFGRCIAGHSWLRCRTSEWSRVVAGIDWGHTNWVVVIGVNAYNALPYLIGMFYVDDSDSDPLGSARAIGQYLAPFEPDLIVADAGYGKDRNAYLLKTFSSRYFACYYNPSEKHSRSFKPQFIQSTNRVLADRTIALKNACQYIREKGLGLPAWDEAVSTLCKHFRALAPLIVEEDGDMYEVIESTGPDHLAHATGYALMAYEQTTAGWGSFDVSW